MEMEKGQFLNIIDNYGYEFSFLDKSDIEIERERIMMPRPRPETNENQHHRFAQHIGSTRRVVSCLVSPVLFFPSRRLEPHPGV
jgi:hypothetical protein